MLNPLSLQPGWVILVSGVTALAEIFRCHILAHGEHFHKRCLGSRGKAVEVEVNFKRLFLTGTRWLSHAWSSQWRTFGVTKSRAERLFFIVNLHTRWRVRYVCSQERLWPLPSGRFSSGASTFCLDL